MKADDAGLIIDRTERMRTARSTFAAHWQEINDYIAPMAVPPNRTNTPGQKAHGNVLDNTGEFAADMLAGALVSILTPDAVDWFALRTEDEALNADHEVAGWLEDTASRMAAAFRAPRGGFSQCQHEKYLEIVTFGTCGAFIADRPGKGLAFVSVPLKQLLLEEDADGFVETVVRDFSLTARQAATRWGRDCGPKVRQAAEDPKKQDQPFRFLHMVEPGADTRTGWQYRSVFVSVEDKHIIRTSGFAEMPYVTPRWQKRGDEVYGRGPGAKALADVKSLQRGVRIVWRGAEKLIDPPLMVADDGVMQSAVRTGPSQISYYRAGILSQDPIKPLNTGGRPDIGEEIMQGVRQRIDNAFLKPLIQMVRQDRMTATEVLQVTEEGQRILGPYLGRLKTEDLGPMVARVFGILNRAGAFLPPPRALAGQVLAVEYVSPGVRSQRVARARGLAQLGEIAAPLLQQDPTILDNLDADRAFRGIADTLGLPQTWLRDPRVVQQMRQARQQAQQEQMQQQQAMQGLDSAANAVRALPALRQAMGGGGAA